MTMTPFLRDLIKQGWNKNIIEIFYRYWDKGEISEHDRRQYRKELTALEAIVTLHHQVSGAGSPHTLITNLFEANTQYPLFERWCIELLQNAIDASSEMPEIELRFEENTMIWSHNGKPFSLGKDQTSPGDWGAIFAISSNKVLNFENHGRFGVGFKGWIFYFKTLTVTQIWKDGDDFFEKSVCVNNRYTPTDLYKNLLISQIKKSEHRIQKTIFRFETYEERASGESVIENTYSSDEDISVSSLFDIQERVYKHLKNTISILDKDVIFKCNIPSNPSQRYVLEHTIETHNQISTLTNIEQLNYNKTTESIVGIFKNLESFKKDRAFIKNIRAWIDMLDKGSFIKKAQDRIEYSTEYLINSWLETKKIFVGVSDVKNNHWLRCFGPLDFDYSKVTSSENDKTCWIVNGPFFSKTNRIYIELDRSKQPELTEINITLLKFALIDISVKVLDYLVEEKRWKLWCLAQSRLPLSIMKREQNSRHFNILWPDWGNQEANNYSDFLLQRYISKPIFFIRKGSEIIRSYPAYKLPKELYALDILRDDICSEYGLSSKEVLSEFLPIYGRDPLNGLCQIYRSSGHSLIELLEEIPKSLLYEILLKNELLEPIKSFLLSKKQRFEQLIKHIHPFDSEQNNVWYEGKIIFIRTPQGAQLKESKLLASLWSLVETSERYYELSSIEEEVFKYYFYNHNPQKGIYILKDTLVITNTDDRPKQTWWYNYLLYILASQNLLTQKQLENIEELVNNNSSIDWGIAQNSDGERAVFAKSRVISSKGFIENEKGAIYKKYFHELSFEKLDEIVIQTTKIPSSYSSKAVCWELSSAPNHRLQYFEGRKIIKLEDAYADPDVGHSFFSEKIFGYSNINSIVLSSKISDELISKWSELINNVCDIWIVKTDRIGRWDYLPRIIQFGKIETRNYQFQIDSKSGITPPNNWNKYFPFVYSALDKPDNNSQNSRRVRYFLDQFKKISENYPISQFEREFSFAVYILFYRLCEKNPDPIYKISSDKEISIINRTTQGRSKSHFTNLKPSKDGVKQQKRNSLLPVNIQDSYNFRYENDWKGLRYFPWYRKPKPLQGEVVNWILFTETPKTDGYRFCWEDENGDNTYIPVEVSSELFTSFLNNVLEKNQYRSLVQALEDTYKRIWKLVFNNVETLQPWLQYWIDLANLYRFKPKDWIPKLIHLNETHLEMIEFCFENKNFFYSETARVNQGSMIEAFKACQSKNWNTLESDMLTRLQKGKAKEAIELFKKERCISTERWRCDGENWTWIGNKSLENFSNCIFITESNAYSFLGINVDRSNQEEQHNQIEIQRWGFSSIKKLVIFKDDFEPILQEMATHLKGSVFSIPSAAQKFNELSKQKYSKISGVEFSENRNIALLQLFIGVALIFKDKSFWNSNHQSIPENFIFPQVNLVKRNSFIESKNTLYPPKIGIGSSGFILEYNPDPSNYKLLLHCRGGIEFSKDKEAIIAFIRRCIFPAFLDDKKIEKQIFRLLKRFSFKEKREMIDESSFPFEDEIAFPYKETIIELFQKLKDDDALNPLNSTDNISQNNISLNQFEQLREKSKSKVGAIDLVGVFKSGLKSFFTSIPSKEQKNIERVFPSLDMLKATINSYCNSNYVQKLYKGTHSMIMDEPLYPLLPNRDYPTHRVSRYLKDDLPIGYDDIFYFAGNQLYLSSFSAYRMKFSSNEDGFSRFDRQSGLTKKIIALIRTEGTWDDSDAFILIKDGLTDLNQGYSLRIHKLHAVFICAFDLFTKEL